MHVKRMVFPVESLGPGKRIALWLAGCSRHCFGCANPDLWNPSSAADYEAEDLAAMLLSLGVSKGTRKLTVSGGEPLEQSEELVRLLHLIRDGFDDVLMFTGYKVEEKTEAFPQGVLCLVEGLVDVVIDGPYIDELNDNKVVLRGSTNQRIHYLNPYLEAEYDSYLAKGRQISNFVYDGQVLSAGIHNRGQAARVERG